MSEATAPVETEQKAVIERTDLLEFRLAIEKEQRFLLATQHAQLVLQSTQRELGEARREKEGLILSLRHQYGLTERDQIDLATGKITRATGGEA